MRQLVNTVVPRSLVALQQHQETITQSLAQKDWDKVNSEQINAARTAQVYMVVEFRTEDVPISECPEGDK